MTEDGRDEAAVRHSRRGRRESTALDKAALAPLRQPLLIHGTGVRDPRKAEVVAQSLHIPRQEPGGRVLLSSCLAALGDGGTPALGAKPVGVARRSGRGTRLPRLHPPGWRASLTLGGDRARARLAVFLRDGAPPAWHGPVVPPPAHALHGCGFLLRGLPECPLAPRGLLARVLPAPFDGSGARGKRGPQQRAQPLALAPCPCLYRLHDPPL